MQSREHTPDAGAARGVPGSGDLAGRSLGGRGPRAPVQAEDRAVREAEFGRIAHRALFDTPVGIYLHGSAVLAPTVTST